VDVSTTVNDGAPINAPIIEEPDDDDEVPTIPMPSDHVSDSTSFPLGHSAILFNRP